MRFVKDGIVEYFGEDQELSEANEEANVIETLLMAEILNERKCRQISGTKLLKLCIRRINSLPRGVYHRLWITDIISAFSSFGQHKVAGKLLLEERQYSCSPYLLSLTLSEDGRHQVHTNGSLSEGFSVLKRSLSVWDSANLSQNCWERARINFYLAVALFKRGTMYQEASTLVDKAMNMRINPRTKATIQFFKAKVLLKLEHLDEALEVLRSVRTQCETDKLDTTEIYGSVLLELGRVMEVEGRTGEALKSYEKCIDVFSLIGTASCARDYGAALCNCGLLFAAEGNARKSVLYLKRALKVGKFSEQQTNKIKSIMERSVKFLGKEYEANETGRAENSSLLLN